MKHSSQDNYKHYSLCLQITSFMTLAFVLLCAYLAMPFINDVASRHDKIFFALACIGLAICSLLAYTNYDFWKMFKPHRVFAI